MCMAREKVSCEICGKQLDRRGMNLHKLKCAEKSSQKAQPANVSQPRDEGEKKKLYEVNLKPEFDKNMTTIQPKKKEAEEQNECGACGGKFAGTPKFCPNCGAELDV